MVELVPAYNLTTYTLFDMLGAIVGVVTRRISIREICPRLEPKQTFCFPLKVFWTSANGVMMENAACGELCCS